METKKCYTDEYWENYLEFLSKKVEEQLDRDGFLDYVTDSYSKLMEYAVRLKQYKPCTTDYEKVTKLVKLKYKINVDLLRRIFNVDSINVYGEGNFVPLEGVMTSKDVRNSSNYDSSGKYSYYSTTAFPDWVVNEYKCGLAIPAFDGLFIPKRCALIDRLSTIKQLEFFDITLFGE